ncbi:MAG: sporulation integral membrane protein YtvI [Christensenellales bacterium]|nr:sporulation integral membrane protein YtvI [Christensenellales bacterium]
MTVEKKKAFLIQAAFYGVLLIAAALFMTYLFGPLCPFLFGFLIAWLLQKPAKLLAQKLHISSRIPAFVFTVIFYAVVFVAVTVAGLQLISALEHLVPKLPALYTTQVVPFMSRTFDALELQMQEVDPSVVDIIDRVSRELFSYLEKLISSLSVNAVRLVSNIIAGMPSVILSVIVTVVSTCFMAMDFDHITSYIKSKLPTRFRTTVSTTITTGVASIRKVLVSYIFIMFMSFVELSIGFLVLRVPYAVGLALLVAVIDILPILGTGLILIPWALFSVVVGDYRMALGLVLLYLIMLVVRNIVEPKLVGQQMGLHPVATLISMFVGLQLFGFIGLIGFPITLSLYIKLASSSKNAKAAAEASADQP